MNVSSSSGIQISMLRAANQQPSAAIELLLKSVESISSAQGLQQPSSAPSPAPLPDGRGGLVDIKV